MKKKLKHFMKKLKRELQEQRRLLAISEEERQQKRLMAATNEESAATRHHDGKLLLRVLSKEFVCLRLAERFPTIVQNIDVEHLAASSLSVESIQCQFWDLIQEEIRARGTTYLFHLIGYRPLSQVWDPYQCKVSPLLLLSDLIFFSDVTTPAFSPNSSLEPLEPSSHHLYIHTKGLSEEVANPEMLIRASGPCENEANRLKALFGDDDYCLFWHGTTGVAAKGIVDEQLLRNSGTGGTIRRELHRDYAYTVAVSREGIFQNSGGLLVNVCLVPEIGISFISSLELRELVYDGTMYSDNFEDTWSHQKLFLTTLDRSSFADSSSSAWTDASLRYPHGSCDRIWYNELIPIDSTVSSLALHSNVSDGILTKLNNLPASLLNDGPNINLSFSYGSNFADLNSDSVRLDRQSLLTSST